ncbi:MAG: DUF4012 domain-containing protein [Candidatus Spechtbacteria bacterium]|nr:DUF4012 domain-containing protein [Candidatus Spechtbacteria bacterium]
MRKANNKEILSRPRKSDRFWRRHIDSTVVDLRKVKANNTPPSQVSKISKGISKPATQGRADGYTDIVKRYVGPRRIGHVSFKYPDTLSQEEILRQISEVEVQDVIIEEGFPKIQKRDDLEPRARMNLIPPVIHTADLPKVLPVRKELVRKTVLKEPERKAIRASKKESVYIPENLPVYISQKDPVHVPEKQLKKQALQDNYGKQSLWHRPHIDGFAPERRPMPKKELKPKSFSPARALRLKTAIFAMTALFVIGGIFSSFKAVAFQDEATIRAEKAYSYMSAGKSALEKLETDEAKEYFQRAREEFVSIEEGFGFLPVQTLNLATIFPFQTQLSSAAHLIKAGKAFSSAGYEISSALTPLKRLPSPAGSVQEQSSFTDNLLLAGIHIQKAKEYIAVADMHLSRVRNQDVPPDFEGEIMNIQNYGGYMEELFDEVLSSLDIFLSFLGHREEKVYMLAFQNSSELRATGGFMGTYGLLTLNKGSIEKLEIDGIYNPDGQLSVNIIPPRPLQYVTPNFGTRDANWFFDFPTSAQKIMELFVQTGGPETNGVIGITPSIVEKLLRLTGPIEMPEYGVLLDANNFLELVQQEVEQDYDRELNRPKQILADLAPVLLEKLERSGLQIEVLNIFFEGLRNKDIMIYSKDQDVEKFLEEKNWDGGMDMIRSSDSVINDYLAVVFSNIGGWKTDKYMDTEVDTVTEVDDQGNVMRTVIISRRHNGGSTPYMWYNRPNYGYMRIYVPEGSELVSAEGFSEEPPYINTNYGKEGYFSDPLVFEIESTLYKHESSNTDVFVESGKTVFGNWLLTPAGERTFVQLKYKLPQKANLKVMSYNLTIQKQSGLPVDYSGSIEDLGEFTDIDSCWMEGKPLSLSGQFTFFQTNDRDISCR